MHEDSFVPPPVLKYRNKVWMWQCRLLVAPFKTESTGLKSFISNTPRAETEKTLSSPQLICFLLILETLNDSKLTPASEGNTIFLMKKSDKSWLFPPPSLLGVGDICQSVLSWDGNIVYCMAQQTISLIKPQSIYQGAGIGVWRGHKGARTPLSGNNQNRPRHRQPVSLCQGLGRPGFRAAVVVWWGNKNRLCQWLIQKARHLARKGNWLAFQQAMNFHGTVITSIRNLTL